MLAVPDAETLTLPAPSFMYNQPERRLSQMLWHDDDCPRPTPMAHHCRFDFPPEKCFDMGCEHFYTQVQTRFETISELLLHIPVTEPGLHSKLSQELESCLRLLRDFHVMFPECSASDCLTDVPKRAETSVPAVV